jgi:hypothetical protein
MINPERIMVVTPDMGILNRNAAANMMRWTNDEAEKEGEDDEVGEQETFELRADDDDASTKPVITFTMSKGAREKLMSDLAADVEDGDVEELDEDDDHEAEFGEGDDEDFDEDEEELDEDDRVGEDDARSDTGDQSLSTSALTNRDHEWRSVDVFVPPHKSFYNAPTPRSGRMRNLSTTIRQMFSRRPVEVFEDTVFDGIFVNFGRRNASSGNSSHVRA